jgi:hypothetical protein
MAGGCRATPAEPDYGCTVIESSMDETRERGILEVCGCTFSESNTVTPRQVRIWHDGTSDPTPLRLRG